MDKHGGVPISGAPMLALIDLWLLSIAFLLHLVEIAPEMDSED